MKYLIIGGGIAGTSCAEELRKLDPDAEITTIEQEYHRLYSRVLLPHYAMGKVEREKCFLKTEEWYQENKIELLLGQSVVKLDSKNKFVELDDARELPYDKLLISTGSEPRVIGGEPRGVVYFWTLDDVDHLLGIIQENKKIKKEKNKAIVYGGGFIACEFINTFQHFGIDTTVAHRGKHFWNSILNDQAGEFVRAHLEKSGVKVVSEIDNVEIVGDKEIETIQINNDQTPCSLLAVAVGSNRDLSFVQEAGIEVDQAIKTNEFLETNVADIYAAGDVAESYDPVACRQYAAGNWFRAMVQGKTVAKTMFGDRTEYKQVSSYAMNLLGLDISFIGDTNKNMADQVKLWGQADEKGMCLIYLRLNKIVGAVILGKNQFRPSLTKAIKSGLTESELK
ncbi:MAG: FAD-dependent oxidoreductase [Candidatus Uhrbacteria bacterium]